MSEIKPGTNNVFAEKLSGLTLDFKSYGKLPMRDDVYLIEQPDPEDNKKKTLLKQSEKLISLRKHLDTIDKYIRLNKGEAIDDWLLENKLSLSDFVLKKLKGHNNNTGGISAYFYNLQNFYDEQEAIYDKMESVSEIPADFKNALDILREERGEKRKTRSEERRLLVKDMKKDGKGYLEIEIEEEPTVEESVSKEESEKLKNGGEKTITEQTEKIKKTTKNIPIWIAGTIIFVTGVMVFVSSTNKET